MVSKIDWSLVSKGLIIVNGFSKRFFHLPCRRRGFNSWVVKTPWISYPIQYSGLESSMHRIVHGSHFRLPMRIADQSVYLTFHLCNANFCFFSKDSVPVHIQKHYINISWFHMPSNSCCFQAFRIFDHLGRVQSII